MEAMKAEHPISDPVTGIVNEMTYGIGGRVADGAQLLRHEGREMNQPDLKVMRGRMLLPVNVRIVGSALGADYKPSRRMCRLK
jgi:hypothetical protein